MILMHHPSNVRPYVLAEALKTGVVKITIIISAL
jgi:hypothetical protein